MQIALLTPTRSRPDRLRKMLASVAGTLSLEHEITCWLGVDADDPQREAVLKMIALFPFAKVVDLPAWGGFPGVGRLWNAVGMHAFNNSDAQLFGMIGDDMVFVTPKWDAIIADTYQNKCHSDGLDLIYCDDANGAKTAVNPFLPRRYIELTGYYAREEFMIDGIDYWQQIVFNTLGRMLYQHNVVIDHQHCFRGKAAVDQVTLAMLAGNQKDPWLDHWNQLEPDRKSEIELLRNYCTGPLLLTAASAQ